MIKLIYLLSGLISLIIIVVILKLSLAEKKTRKEIEREKIIRQGVYYRNRLKKIIKSVRNKKKLIEDIDNLAKEFFSIFYSTPAKVDYSELYEKFKQENNKACAEFSGLMINFYYSPEKITKDKVKDLAQIFKTITEENTQRVLKLWEEKELNKLKEEGNENLEKIERDMRILGKQLNKLSEKLKTTDKKELTRDEYLREVIKEDPFTFITLKNNLYKMNLTLSNINNLIQEIYEKSNEKRKIEISSILKEWMQKKVEIGKNPKNYFWQIKMEYNLMLSNLKKIKNLIE